MQKLIDDTLPLMNNKRTTSALRFDDNERRIYYALIFPGNKPPDSTLPPNELEFLRYVKRGNQYEGNIGSALIEKYGREIIDLVVRTMLLICNNHLKGVYVDPGSCTNVTKKNPYKAKFIVDGFEKILKDAKIVL